MHERHETHSSTSVTQEACAACPNTLPLSIKHIDSLCQMFLSVAGEHKCVHHLQQIYCNTINSWLIERL